MNRLLQPQDLKIRLSALLILWLAIIFPQGQSASETVTSSSELDFYQKLGKWYEYKRTQPLNEQQRNIISYIEQADRIVDEADNTRNASPKRPMPHPKEALETVEKCIREFSKLNPPPTAKKHYAASLQVLEIAKKYQLIRLRDPNSENLLKLAGSSIPHEGIRSAETFRMMHEVGLMDNIEEEMIQLGLEDPNEINKNHNFFKEYKNGEAVLCPKCGKPMKRVRVLYKDDPQYQTADWYESLPGDRRFEGSPDFGYRCNTCYVWYEEHPGPKKDSFTIRNWGWSIKENRLRAKPR